MPERIIGISLFCFKGVLGDSLNFNPRSLWTLIPNFNQMPQYRVICPVVYSSRIMLKNEVTVDLVFQGIQSDLCPRRGITVLKKDEMNLIELPCSFKTG